MAATEPVSRAGDHGSMMTGYCVHGVHCVMTGGGQGGAGRSVDSKIYLRCSGERRWLVPLGAMKLLQVHGRYLVDSRYIYTSHCLVPATGRYVTRHGVLKTPYIPHFQYIRKLCIDFSTRVSSLINYQLSTYCVITSSCDSTQRRRSGL